MLYRMATEKDVRALSDMRWEHEYEENGDLPMTREDFAKECCPFLLKGIQSGSWVCWVAEEGGEIVANIYINRIQKLPRPQKLFLEMGYVTNVHTRPEYRNRGIGTALLGRVREWAAGNEMELLVVWPSERSVPYYERQGFLSQNQIMELRF